METYSRCAKLLRQTRAFVGRGFPAIAGIVLALVLAVPPRANSALDAAATCEVSKLAAAENYAVCQLRVSAKATARQQTPFFFNCQHRFSVRWAKVETKGRAACPTRGDAETIGTEIRKAADEARMATGSSARTVPCAATQQKALARYLRCAFTAYAKARKNGQLLDLTPCAVNLDKAFAATAASFPSACTLTSIGKLRDHLNVRVAEIALHLSGVQPTPTAAPTCGDGHLDRPTEECDGTDAYDCPGNCRDDCTCPNQAARIKLNAYVAQIAGRPGHQGLYPIMTEPVIGQSAYVVASVWGPYATAAFRFVDENNHDIAPITLSLDDPLAASGEYVGYVQLPSQPFRIAASGTTRDGSAYNVQGEYLNIAHLYQPQSIAITLDDSLGKPTAGGTMTLHFGLTNHGQSDTFNLSVSDTLGLASLGTPSTVVLASEEAATVAVILSAPASPPVRWDVTFTATSVGNPSVRNSITLPVDAN
jgi:hypothetical protein